MCGATSQDLYVQPDTNLGEKYCKKNCYFCPFQTLQDVQFDI